MQQTHEFHLTGAARKPLIEAIEGFTRVKGVYQGMPKMGYAFHGIGTLNKEGAFNFDCDQQIIMDLLAHLNGCGFTPEGNESAAPEIVGEDARVAAYARLSTFEQAPQEDYPDRLCIELPLDGFTPDKLDNLFKMVAAKEPLLKTALGVEELPIQVRDECVAFPWFKFTDDGETVNAYAQFIAALCKTTKEKQRVTAKAQEDCPNPRFTMRCWCISLGLIGPEFKKIRHLLCSPLDGNGAFSRGFDPRKVQVEGGADCE